MKITIIVVIGQLFTSSTAAYAFARLKFPGRDMLFGILLISLMIPIQVTIIPIYIGLSKVGLVDNHLSLILPSIVNAFGIFLMRQFFLTLPKDLEDAGKIDGAGYWTIYWRIALPQAIATLSALSILSFNSTWNNYFAPLIFITSWEKMTITLGVAALRGYMGSGNLSQMMAGVTLAILPVLILFLFLQRYIVESLTTTGIKG
jgi:multiple sugar transport system permease protein